MPHHTWAYPPHPLCSWSVEAWGSTSKLSTALGARRSYQGRVRAAPQDLAGVSSAAALANGRAHNIAMAYTMDPAVSTEWVCPPNPQQYRGLSHIALLHGRQQDSHSRPSHSSQSSQVSGPEPTRQQEQSSQEPVQLDQPHQQQDQRQPTSLQSLQHEEGVATLSEGLKTFSGSGNARQSRAEQLRVQQQQQQNRQRPGTQQREHQHIGQVQQKQQPRRQQKAPPDRACVGQHARTAEVRVTNNTSAVGMAQYLLSKVRQQLKKAQQQQQQQEQLQEPPQQQNTAKPEHTVDWLRQLQSRSSSQQSITLLCCSGKSLHTALQAIGLAAQQAANLRHPQQLLLQPQLVWNALDTAADGRHGAGAYQLQVLWVPAGAAAVYSQVVQQQQPLAAVQQQQQQQQCMPVRRHQCSGPQHDMQWLSASSSVGAMPKAANDTAAGGADVHQPPQLLCDPSAALTEKQSKGKHKGHFSSSSSTRTSTASRRPPSVQAVSWHVSGLLRGNWPAQLQCSCPAGALTAVKALVRARKQLAAAGMDMLIAVTVPAQGGAAGSVAAAGDSGCSGELVTLRAVGYAVQQTERGPKGATADTLSHVHQAEFVSVLAAEQYLRQQQHERRRHKQMLVDLQQQHHQQQHSAPTLSLPDHQQQQQQTGQHIASAQQQHVSGKADGAHGLEGHSLLAEVHLVNSSDCQDQQRQLLLPAAAPCSPVPVVHHLAGQEQQQHQQDRQQQQQQLRQLSLQGLSRPHIDHLQPSYAAAFDGSVAARSTSERRQAPPQQQLQPQGPHFQQPIMLPV